MHTITRYYPDRCESLKPFFLYLGLSLTLTMTTRLAWHFLSSCRGHVGAGITPVCHHAWLLCSLWKPLDGDPVKSVRIKVFPGHLLTAAILLCSRTCGEGSRVLGGAHWGCQCVSPPPQDFASLWLRLHSLPLTCVHCFTANQRWGASFVIEAGPTESSGSLGVFIVIDQCLLTSDPARLGRRTGINKAAEGGFWSSNLAATFAFRQGSSIRTSCWFCSSLQVGGGAWFLARLTSVTESICLRGFSHQTYRA